MTVTSSATRLQHSTQHHVVVNVTVCDNVLVQTEILFGDMILPGWMVLHVAVTEMVDGVKVDRGKIPGLSLQ